MRGLFKWFIRAVWVVWILIMLLLGMKLAFDNTQTVQVVLFGWQAPALSLGFILSFVLLCGVVLGWLASSGPYVMARQRAKRLEKQLQQSRGEVAALRTAPLKN